MTAPAGLGGAPVAPARVVQPLAPALIRYAVVCVPVLALTAVVLGWVYPGEAAQQAVRAFGSAGSRVTVCASRCGPWMR